MSIILGLDPGLANLGYGLINQQDNKLKYISSGLIKTPARESNAERLLKIHQELKKIIKKHKPDIIAFEELFFCKNVKTALVVGQVIGVITLTAGQNKIKIGGYTPLEIKQTLTSYGLADKKQMAMMVKMILNLNEVLVSNHATDALACAICCAHIKLWTKN